MVISWVYILPPILNNLIYIIPFHVSTIDIIKLNTLTNKVTVNTVAIKLGCTMFMHTQSCVFFQNCIQVSFCA